MRNQLKKHHRVDISKVDWNAVVNNLRKKYEIPDCICNTVAAYVRWNRIGNMTQTELAKKCGCSRQTISKLESACYEPSKELMAKIETAFGKPTGDMWNVVRGNLIAKGLVEDFSDNPKELLEGYGGKYW